MRKGVLAIVAFLAFASCGAGDNPTPYGGNSVSVLPESLSTGSAAARLELTVTADCDWGIAPEDKSWVSVSPGGGIAGNTVVSVSVDKNGTDDVRTTGIVIRYAGGSLTVPLRQNYEVVPVEFSDAAFMAYLLANFDSDGDGVLSIQEASAITRIEASGLGIKDISGLAEKLPALTWLDCSDNEIGSLDISSLFALTYLDCSGNPLTEVMVWTGFTPTENFTIPEGASYVEPEIPTPVGYALVWHDEFNEGTVPGKDWTHEVKNSGWVNNELQNYRNGVADGKRVTEVEDGILRINCFKGSDGKIYSGRIYGCVGTGWQYAYVEASIKLPKGKGTWPAFWMMPVHFTAWPDDGEIDIMEEVGYRPNYVSSSLHATGHVHSNNTQVTQEYYCKGAEEGFHTYGMEWTADYFQFYVDGQKTLYYKNPGTGKRDWPYDAPFYVILNLAWGGSWGGAQGVDESALPVTMEVDYVRVFQKID